MQLEAQSSTPLHTGRRGLNLIALLVFALLFAGFEYGGHRYGEQKRQEALTQLRDDATRVHRVMQAEITTTVALGNGIESYILARNGKVYAADVGPLLAVTFERGGYFRNLGLAPDNRVEYVFPLKGNEAATRTTLPGQPQAMAWGSARHCRTQGPL